MDAPPQMFYGNMNFFLDQRVRTIFPIFPRSPERGGRGLYRRVRENYNVLYFLVPLSIYTYVWGTWGLWGIIAVTA
jgi:hypothetical protein